MEALIGLVFLAVWLFPIYIGWNRKVKNVGSIAVITILLGWTIIGWIIALAMAFATPNQTTLQN
jgi:hypothetical protein